MGRHREKEDPRPARVAAAAVDLLRRGNAKTIIEEDTLVLVLPRSSTWWETWEDDWLEDAEDGTPVVPFASLIVCTTNTARLTDVEVELAPNVDASVEPDIYDPDLHPRLSSEGVLTLRLPWGDATVDLSAAPARVRITQP